MAGTQRFPDMQTAPVTRAAIAQMLGLAGAASGGDATFRRVSGYADAEPETVVFASDAAMLAAAMDTSAGLILATQDAPVHDARVLHVRNPRLAFALVQRHFFADRDAVGVHPSASVDLGARLGPGCSVGALAVIEAGVVLGAACQIGPGVRLLRGTTLGARVRVQAGAVLGAEGFGFVRGPEGYVPTPQIGSLVLEDDVDIGANTTIDRGALGETRIGRGTKIDNLVHIAHNCRIGANVVIAAQTGVAGSTVIEDDAVIGGQVGLGDHVTIGRGVILGSGAGVLPHKRLEGAGQLFWGTPAQPVRAYLRDLARLRRG